MKPSQPRSTPMLECTGRLGNLGVSIALEEEGTLLVRGGHGTVNCKLSEAPKSSAYHGGTKGANPACSSEESDANLTSSPCRRIARAKNEPSSARGHLIIHDCVLRSIRSDQEALVRERFGRPSHSSLPEWRFAKQ